MTKTIRSIAPTMPSLDEEELVRYIAGELRLVWHNQAIPLRLRGDDLAEYEGAKERGYCIGRTAQQAIFWAYNYWCEIHGRPYIKVELRAGRATAVLDMITSHRHLCPHQEAAIYAAVVETLGTARAAKLQDHVGGGSFFRFGTMLEEDGRSLAARYWEISTGRCKECPA